MTICFYGVPGVSLGPGRIPIPASRRPSADWVYGV